MLKQEVHYLHIAQTAGHDQRGVSLLRDVKQRREGSFSHWKQLSIKISENGQYLLRHQLVGRLQFKGTDDEALRTDHPVAHLRGRGVAAADVCFQVVLVRTAAVLRPVAHVPAN